MPTIGIEKTAAYSTADITQGRAGFRVGDAVMDDRGDKFRFVQASGTVAQYDVVGVNSAGVAQALTKAIADTGPMIGVAMATLSSGEFGYVQVTGVTTVNVLSTCSAGVALYTSGTAGKLDDTTTSQTKIAGIQIVANVTDATATAAIIATEPFAAL